MAGITSRDLIAMFGAVAAAIAAERDRLCALDGVIGDADHGITMDVGFAAATRALAGAEAAEPTQIFNLAAKSFLNAVGASAGPLYATAFMRAGAAVKGKAVLDQSDIAAIVVAMAAGIRDRGKAVPGEKTMVDAWDPAADAARDAAADPLAAAAAAAEAGARTTADMVATKGRAARLGERARGHIDPGAASAAIILAAMAAALGQSAVTR
jgi:dihydroxyacetone kinase-like protein